jgi:histidinol-phosphate phosphatase family protein
MAKSKSSVVILAGGRGTRLNKIIGDLPKPMTPILGIPVLEYLIRLCVRHNFFNITLLVCHNYHFISDYFGDGSRFGAMIDYSVEAQPRGTAGALYDALHLLDSTFIVLYGDTYTQLNLRKFWDFHARENCDGSILVHPNNHPYDSDILVLDENNFLTNVMNYPHPDGLIYQNLVNAGMYVFKNKLISNHGFFSSPSDIAKDLFPRLISSEVKLKGYKTIEYIKDMGTPERLSKVEAALDSGMVAKLSDENPKSCIFLDRDGTIIHEVGHLSAPEQVELLPGVSEAIRGINEAGLLSIVATNQPVIARGDIDFNGLNKIHNLLETKLGLEGAYLDEIYVCPHHPEKGHKGERLEYKILCNCRKPATGLIDAAIQKLDIDRRSSWMIGDSTVDVLAGRRAGLKTIMLGTGHAGLDRKCDIASDYYAPSLSEAVDWALQGHSKIWRLLDKYIEAAAKEKCILIGGLSRSGKSSIAQVLAEKFTSSGFRAHTISLDGWLRPAEERRDGEGIISRYNLSDLTAFIVQILSSRAPLFLQIPIYNKSLRKIQLSDYKTYSPNDKFIIEGIPIFYCVELLSFSNMKIYVEENEQIRLQRIRADYHARGKSDHEIDQLIRSRALDEEPFIRSSISKADYIIRNNNDIKQDAI